MQLDELIGIIIEEARSSHDDLAGCSAVLSTLADGAANEGALDAAAATYANFCERAATAAQSLGLAGLSLASSSIGEGLAMASSLPLEMRVPAAPLLKHWPDFFMGYLGAWSHGRIPSDQQAPVSTLLANMLQAEYVTPLDETQFADLRAQLLSPPLVADQQAALLPPFELPGALALSLDSAADAEAEVLDGFLSEGPAQIERLAGIVAGLVRGLVSPAQLELAHRTAHTLKGTAAIAGVRGVATLAHALEDILEAFRRDDFVPPTGLEKVMTAGCDQLELALDHLAGEGPAPEEFGQVTCRLHAWACHFQGIAVPPDLLVDEGAANDGREPTATATTTATATATPTPAPMPAPAPELAPSESQPVFLISPSLADLPEPTVANQWDAIPDIAQTPGTVTVPAEPKAREDAPLTPLAALPTSVAPGTPTLLASSPLPSIAPALPIAPPLPAAPAAPVLPSALVAPMAAVTPAIALPPLLPVLPPMRALPAWPMMIPAVAPAPASGDPDAASEDELQIRISAKALDKIFRAVNELAVGLLRLRTQNDDILVRSNALSALDQVATQRLADIEQLVTLKGLGRSVGTATGGGHGPDNGPDHGSDNGAGDAGQPLGNASFHAQGWQAGANGAMQALHGGFDALEMDRYNELTGATQALNEALDDLRGARDALAPSLRDVSALTQRQLDIAREARFQLAQARLRPLSSLRARLRRTVRQTSAAVGRDALLEITGDDLRVDAAVLGPLSEALLHLLRNCVDHGMEAPQERIAAGKPAQGTIRVAFAGLGSGVAITVADDGRGLDHEAILNKAMWSGLVPADAKLSQQEIGRLIFLPGFSTRSAVTETSGRGVGLDAVAQAVASLQGNVNVTSQRGSGTEFRLFVLSTVGTVHALHLQAGGEHFLVPSTQLERVDAAPFLLDLQLDAKPESQAAATQSLQQLLHGSGALGHNANVDLDSLPALVINVDGVQRRIAVDRTIEAREFLISRVPTLIDRMPGVSGVATLADGSLGLVLDLIDLSRKPLPVQAQGLQQLAAALQDQEQLHILVTDDSASVRNTLSALLRDENYRVTTARDGLEAMRAMQDHRFSLVLTDLEMPQANGFELTEFIRNRSSQPRVPVIMLTSRGQDKHRERAAAVGVNAFLVKPYSDEGLLQAMRSALGAAPGDSLRSNDPLPGDVQDNADLTGRASTSPLPLQVPDFAKAFP